MSILGTANKKVLVVQYSASLDGSAFSALMLADGMKAAGWDTCVCFGTEGPMVLRFQESGHKVLKIPHKSWLRSISKVRFLRNLFKEYQVSNTLANEAGAFGPDVVYINTAVSIAGVLAARKLGRPCVWHLREMFSDVGGEMKTPYRKLVTDLFGRLSDQLIVNSKAVADNMLGKNGAKAVIIPNAVEPHFFEDNRSQKEARNSLGVQEEGFIIGVPGTLRPMKGHPFFFNALAKLVKSRPDVKVIVSGSGEKGYEQQLKDLVHEMDLDPYIRFLGNIHDMIAFYKASDLACIPSVAEPFGRTVIESFATGTPVVASAVGGICEIVHNDKLGRLVEYGDVNALANELVSLIDDRELRHALQENALMEARDKYQLSVYQKRVNEVVQQL